MLAASVQSLFQFKKIQSSMVPTYRIPLEVGGQRRKSISFVRVCQRLDDGQRHNMELTWNSLDCLTAFGFENGNPMKRWLLCQKLCKRPSWDAN